MKKTHLVTPLLIGAMLVPATLSAPSAHAVEPTTTISATATHELSASDAHNSLQLLNARIATLQSVQKSVPGSDYSDQIRDLLKAAFDLRGLIDTLAHGGIPFYDPSTIMPRIKLAATTIDTIHTATTTLQNKVRPAHVELGLEVHRQGTRRRGRRPQGSPGQGLAVPRPRPE